MLLSRRNWLVLILNKLYCSVSTAIQLMKRSWQLAGFIQRGYWYYQYAFSDFVYLKVARGDY